MSQLGFDLDTQYSYVAFRPISLDALCDAVDLVGAPSFIDKDCKLIIFTCKDKVIEESTENINTSPIKVVIRLQDYGDAYLMPGGKYFKESIVAAFDDETMRRDFDQLLQCWHLYDVVSRGVTK